MYLMMEIDLDLKLREEIRNESRVGNMETFILDDGSVDGWHVTSHDEHRHRDHILIAITTKT